MTKVQEGTGVSDYKLVMDQLVGPEHRRFGRMRYRDSPATVCPTTIALAQPCLTQAQMAQLLLRTTALLSLFGIYIHQTSGMLIVYCRDRESFAIRRNPYELQDVVNRTGRWDFWLSGKAKSGAHYVAADGADDIKRRLGARERIGWEALSAEITQLEKRYSMEVPNEVVFGDARPQRGAPIPLLPIYLGWPKRMSLEAGCDLCRIAHVDYSAPDYRAQMNAHRPALRLYQVIYFSMERVPYQVELVAPEWCAAPINEALDAFLRSDSRALAEFVRRWCAHKHSDGSGHDGATRTVPLPPCATPSAHASSHSSPLQIGDEFDEFYQAIEAQDEEKKTKTATQPKNSKRERAPNSAAQAARAKKAHLQSDNQRNGAEEDTALEAFYSVLI
ncbi:hypothetical protein BRETT_000451 [Brettanomyces bruxellensis]|uniref:Uncharacterized protein n=1 Tax=Dekkera bruxellensis TaxID=5007 RepID=A0A871RAC6_DEKBR|nr:uncharacterized protein BRETT_000451 [Brettanomyces bruxellensis]QOU20738.1 hypothetical protein BRETT_000451 [Brettanomyces bruxellensis]